MPLRSAKTLFDRLNEPVRFLLVGAWNTGFNYGVFALLLWLLGPVLQPLAASDVTALAWIGSHWYLVVQWLAWALSVPQSTLAFKLLVFRSTGHWAHEIVRSYAVYLPLQFVSTGLLWLFVTLGGLHPLLGQLLTAGIAAVMSYLGNKYFTFRAPKPQ